MSGLIKGAQLEFLEIEQSAVTPIYRQIEGQIRNAVLTGIIKPGLRLPASRVLARDIGVSRPTVVQVYEYLSFEGFLETRRGAGTFVSRTLPNYIPSKSVQPESSKSPNRPAIKPLSIMGAKLADLKPSMDRAPFAPFLPNVPAFDQFPISRWQKIRNRCIRLNKTNLLGYEIGRAHV